MGLDRKFDITDAIAIVGLNSFKTPSLGTKDDVVLVYKNAKIVITKNGDIELNNTKCIFKLAANGALTISNDQENLLSILDDTLNAIANITVNGAIIDNKNTFLGLKTRLEKLT